MTGSILIAVVIAFLGASPLSSTEPCPISVSETLKSTKFIHVKNNFVLVEFHGQETIFHDQILEREMKERGVLIPLERRTEYQGKSSIRLGEPGFQKAFREIFAAQLFDPNNYIWQD
jgi:hypothetical protein